MRDSCKLMLTAIMIVLLGVAIPVFLSLTEYEPQKFRSTAAEGLLCFEEAVADPEIEDIGNNEYGLKIIHNSPVGEIKSAPNTGLMAWLTAAIGMVCFYKFNVFFQSVHLTEKRVSDVLRTLFILQEKDGKK